MLNDKDSKRVADAIIAEMEGVGFAVSAVVGEAIRSALCPNGWKRDWFPLTVEDEMIKLRRDLSSIAEESARNKK